MLFDEDRAVLECTDPDTGEFDIDKYTALTQAAESKIQRASHVANSYKTDTAKIDALKKELERIRSRIEVLQKNADNKKNYVKMLLDGEKYEDASVKISFRKSTKLRQLESCDVDELDDEYKIIDMKITPDKAKIKLDLKKGKTVSGFILEENNNIIIK